MKAFFTINKFVEKYPNFLTEGGLRHLIFNEDTNGFGVCIRRVGRRILLDESAVFAWVDQHASQTQKSNSNVEAIND